MVTTRHDNAMQLVCRYARSCGVLASTEPKDVGSLVPDGEFHFSSFSCLVDLRGVHSLAPSHLVISPNPGQAMESRASTKESKYQAHADERGCLFVPLITDAFGHLHRQLLSFLDRIEEQALAWGSAASPSRISREIFLAELSSSWQRDNARIILQFTSMCRMAAFR